MGKEAMLAALNLEMPDRVPRTEFSAETHWPLVRKVTGLNVDEHSSPEERLRASQAFIREWDYGMIWNNDIYRDIFNGKYTDMGHAVYAAGGVDYRDYVKTLLEDPEDVFTYNLFDEHGIPDTKSIIKKFDDNFARLEKTYPDCVNMNGIYVTCISGVLDLLGWDTLLMAAGIDLEGFGKFVNHYCDFIQYYYNALAECKSPVVMVHDDFVWGNGGFMSPAFYKTFVFPNYKRLWAPLREAGKKILFTSDGNYTQYVDNIVDCGVHGFVMEPVTDMKYIAEKYGKTHVFIGNAETSVLLLGTREQIENEVRRCMDIGKNCPGFVMAVGNHIPSNTPVENALWYNDCYQKYSLRAN